MTTFVEVKGLPKIEFHENERQKETTIKIKEEFEELSSKIGTSKALEFYNKYTSHYTNVNGKVLCVIPDKTIILIMWEIFQDRLIFLQYRSFLGEDNKTTS